MPGMYLQTNHVDVRIYSGAHNIEKEQLYRFRKEIAENMNEFNKLINAQDFKEIYGEIKGEKNKRIEKELQEAGEKQPLIYNKNFYYFFKMDSKVLLQKGLIDKVIEGYQIALPVNRFFEEAVE